ncbi:MAG: glucokinase [Gammaproteobacteria bacterium]|nr:glucokinase [Gammaproteobacteria bacterium]
MSSYSKFVADIGGTHARFALVDDDISHENSLVEMKVFKCADFAGPAETVIAYQEHLGGRLPARACIAAAGPLDDGVVRFTNLDWRLSARELQDALHLEQLELLNDFAAVAYSVTALRDGDLHILHSGQPPTEGARTVLGAGTGLGVAALVNTIDQHTVMTSEAGHVRFAAANAEQSAVLDYLLREHDYVSMEMLLAGPGIPRLYHALAAVNGLPAEPLDAKVITQLALATTDLNCINTMALYTQILAGFCAQLAMTFHARGGVYLVGDIFRAMQPLLSSGEFVNDYLSAGPMAGLVEATPLSIVLTADPGLQGAAVRVKELRRARVLD